VTATTPTRDTVIPRLILQTAKQCTKFEDPSFNRSKDILKDMTISIGSREGFVVHGLGRAMINSLTKFEVTGYEDTELM